MPKETFWSVGPVEGDGSNPVLTVAWGSEQPTVTLNDVEFDESAIRRLIRTLRVAGNLAPPKVKLVGDFSAFMPPGK